MNVQVVFDDNFIEDSLFFLSIEVCLFVKLDSVTDRLLDKRRLEDRTFVLDMEGPLGNIRGQACRILSRVEAYNNEVKYQILVRND